MEGHRTGEGIRIKICGIMTEQDCRIVNRFMPDYAGFVFAATRHFVSDECAAALRNALDPQIPAVGVFVNDDPRHIAELVNAGTIQFVQLHGQEDSAYIAELRELIMETVQDRRWRKGDNGCNDDQPQIPFIRALRLGGEAAPAGLQERECDYLLLDAFDRKAPGGNGRRFDLKLLPKRLDKPWFLAGGLDPENVVEVIKEARGAAEKSGLAAPFAVDVSSGVESREANGHKDERLMERFISEVRNYGKGL